MKFKIIFYLYLFSPIFVNSMELESKQLDKFEYFEQLPFDMQKAILEKYLIEICKDYFSWKYKFEYDISDYDLKYFFIEVKKLFLNKNLTKILRLYFPAYKEEGLKIYLFGNLLEILFI